MLGVDAGAMIDNYWCVRKAIAHGVERDDILRVDQWAHSNLFVGTDAPHFAQTGLLQPTEVAVWLDAVTGDVSGTVGFHACEDVRPSEVECTDNGKCAGVNLGGMDVIVVAKAMVVLVRNEHMAGDSLSPAKGNEIFGSKAWRIEVFDCSIWCEWVFFQVVWIIGPDMTMGIYPSGGVTGH